MNKHILALLCIVWLVAAAAAQTEETGKNEFSVWGGLSPDSNTFIQAFGRTRDARFDLVAVRYTRRVYSGRVADLKYTADLVPVATLNYRGAGSAAARSTRYAFGLAPLGVQANFRPEKRIQPFVGTSGGMLYFSRRTPDTTGTRFAFTADIGAGIEFIVNRQRRVTIGYKYYHISNGDRGIQNPGFDNNLFYVGYTFFSR